jgi:hypothetical protein
LQKIAATCDRGPKSDGASGALRPEHFPLRSIGREIVTQDGAVIAVAADTGMSEEIALLLNATDWTSLEELWAL